MDVAWQASATAATLLSMLDDYDRLLSSDSNFMLGEPPLADSIRRQILLLSCNVVTPISAASQGRGSSGRGRGATTRKSRTSSSSMQAQPIPIPLSSFEVSKEAALQARNQITLWGPTGQINDCAHESLLPCAL